jgi:hypothetical protein
MADEENPILALVRQHTDTEKIQDESRLVALLSDAFDTEEKKLFLASFYMYQRYHKVNDYVVDLDDVWKWLGFLKKSNAKRLLVSKFQEDVDYKIRLFKEHNVDNDHEENPVRGRPKESICMNIDTFKTFCQMADTAKAKEIRMYYVKLEDVMINVVDEERKRFLLERDEMTKRNIALVKQLEKAEKRAPKKDLEGYLYIGGNLKNEGDHVYKIGKTKDLANRLTSANTWERDRSNVYYRTFEVTNRDLAEMIAHKILDEYVGRYNNTEFYQIPFEKLIDVLNATVAFTNLVWQSDDIAAACKKTYRILNPADEALQLHPTTNNTTNNDTTNNINNNTTNDSHDTNNVTINLNVNASDLKFLTQENYDAFINEVLAKDMSTVSWTKDLLIAIGKWLDEKGICAKEPILGGNKKNYGFFQQAFKDEVMAVLTAKYKTREMAHETGPRINGKRPPRAMGMRGIRINQDTTE